MLKSIKYILKPLLDIFQYFKIFEIYLGKRMYLIFLLSIVASLFEGIGILMLLPLLETLDGSVPQNPDQSQISEFLFNVIEFIGLSNNITSILLLISISFTIKGLVVFSALAFNAFLSGELLKELKIKLFKLYSGMKYSYYSSKNTGKLLNIINEQPTRALEAFRQLTLMTSHIINTIILLFLAFLISTSLSLGSLLLKKRYSISRSLVKIWWMDSKQLLRKLKRKWFLSTTKIYQQCI